MRRQNNARRFYAPRHSVRHRVPRSPQALWGVLWVWRRMAYFGDATAHAAILGVALALLFGTSIFLGVGFIAFLMSVLIFALSGKGQSVDTILGVLSHGALALGLVAVTMIPNQRINLDAYLLAMCSP